MTRLAYAVVALLSLSTFLPCSAGVIITSVATDPTVDPSTNPTGAPFPFTGTNSVNLATSFFGSAQSLGTASIHGFGGQDTTHCSGLFANGNVAWSYTGSFSPSFSCATDTQTGDPDDGFNAFGDANWLGINTGSLTLTFLSSPTRSFGAFFSGLGASLTASFNDGTSQSLTIPLIAGGNGLEFWGFTDTSNFSQITIAFQNACGAIAPCDNFGIDGIIFNNSIPEPGAVALLGLGLAGLAALRRRKTNFAARSSPTAEEGDNRAQR